MENQENIATSEPKVDQEEQKKQPRNRGLVAQFASFLWKRKLYWLAPIVILLLIVGILVFVGQSSTISPFIYALF